MTSLIEVIRLRNRIKKNLNLTINKILLVIETRNQSSNPDDFTSEFSGQSYWSDLSSNLIEIYIVRTKGIIGAVGNIDAPLGKIPKIAEEGLIGSDNVKVLFTDLC